MEIQKPMKPNLNKYISSKRPETKNQSNLLYNKYSIINSSKNPNTKSSIKIHDDSDILNEIRKGIYIIKVFKRIKL